MTETIKVEKEEETEEAASRNPGIRLLLVIIGIVGLLLLAFMAGKSFHKQSSVPTVEDQLTYNNFQFVKIEGLWYFQWQYQEQPYNIALHFSPKEVEDVEVVGELDQRFSRDSVYVTYDPLAGDFGNLSLAAGELTTPLAQVFKIQPIAACTQKTLDACMNRPIVTCNSTNSPVIFLNSTAPEPKIVMRGNCLELQGKGFDILKAIDKSHYVNLGIIRQ